MAPTKLKGTRSGDRQLEPTLSRNSLSVRAPAGVVPARVARHVRSMRGNTAVGRPAAFLSSGDHCCPSVSQTNSNDNRARRIKRNKMKAAAIKDRICRAPFAEPIFSFPKEYIDMLKARYPERSYYGGPDYSCHFCSAVFWYDERLGTRSNRSEIVYSGCCRGGTVSLPKHRPFPLPLKDLICFDGGARSNAFMRLIRHYNSLFAFSSLGVHVDKSINTGDGPYIFRINGVVHHRIGSLLPPPGKRPEYAQLYIYDTPNEVHNRISLFSGDGSDQPDPHIVSDLITMLNANNPLVRQFRMARDRLLSPTAPDIAIRLSGTLDGHGDRYSLPAAPELAGLLIGGLTPNACSFDVVVETHTSQLKHISPIHPALMSLQYPLLFPFGDPGYHTGIIRRQTEGRSSGRKNVSMLEFHAYYMHYRPGEPNPATCSGRLSQQYEVNCYSCVEANRLAFYFFNQDLLRSETYQGISDAVCQGATTGKDVGIKRMLPASHIGSRRYMQQNFHDCMAICCAYGAPDKFTTFTCNSKWPEIAEALRCEPGQKPADRPDMVVRVFHMKLEEYLTDIKEGHIFGPVRAVAHTNEFQKRGLPHSHILVWQTETGREPSPSEVDKYISAELPDPNVDPLGFSLVQEFMVHGPCGAANPNSPCMKNGKCSKKYPKPFCNETSFDSDGYPLYRRRDNGIVVWKGNVRLDNRWIVPHNLTALKKYQAHINVEACNRSYLIKYLFKYVNKGFDCARVNFHKRQPNVTAHTSSTPSTSTQPQSDDGAVDEIAEYIRSRYLSACEATWRLFGFEIHGKFPSVERLFVHLPGMNFVTVHEEADLEAVVTDPESGKSMLTEWFTTNQTSTDGHDLTYCQFPSRYTWDSGKKKWRRRKKGNKLGRLRFVHISTGETFYLRMLLMVVRGASSYEEVRTYQGTVYSTFRQACQARGLIGDDTEWTFLFDEAITWATSYQLRNLFITVLLYCNVGNVRALFEKYWKYMADDVAYRLRAVLQNAEYTIPDSVLQSGLMKELSQMFSNNGLSITSYDLPLAWMTPANDEGNRLIMEEMSYDKTALLADSIRMTAALNAEQRNIHSSVMDAISRHEPFAYFVSGHGGTGKTFLWNTILATLRSQDHIVLAVASCGVASLLLPGGRTAHSRFKIPLDVHENSLCGIGRGTMLAALITRASLIIWDEAPMSHRHCFEAVDRTLRDIMAAQNERNASLPFGGKPILLGGDFRQVLPVVDSGDRNDIIKASLLGSYLWKHIKVMRLSINMRLCNPALSSQEKISMGIFAKWILDIGEGKVPTVASANQIDKDWIRIPQDLVLSPDGPKIPAIATAIYDNFQHSYSSIPYLAERSIVCPVNTIVDEINSFMLDTVPGNVREYLSFDSIANSSEQPSDFEMLYPPEFLNSIVLNNFPQHRLHLKVGVPVVLLRNINQSIGLRNGTRLLIERLGDRLLEGRIMTGNHVGDTVCIPRIVLNGTSQRWPFTLQRRQFPIKVCYAMTINKCQGQTLGKVGVYLREPVFTHGQLYVAVSRVNSNKGLSLLIEDDDGEPVDVTRNIVYQEVLDHV